MADCSSELPGLTVAIAASVKTLEKGKSVQRKISGFLLDAQIVSTNDKRRAKKAKEDKEDKEVKE